MDWIELVGWLGAAGFALSAIPQAYKCYAQGHGRGLSYPFLFLWCMGEACMLVYTIVRIGSLPLLFNYAANLACLLIILRYRIWERPTN